MGLSRSEGYRRGAGKEEDGLRVTEEFFRSVVEISLERIDDPQENYEQGDFRSPNGGTLECKRQPIGRYPRNFIEVCERTSGRNAAHLTGFEDLASVLAIDFGDLMQVGVNERGVRSAFGRPTAISVSVTSLLRAAYWVYVNPASSQRFLYIYRSRDLLDLVRKAVKADGLELGKGNSNDDTYAVLVPNPAWRWTSKHDADWRFSGEGSETTALHALRTSLA